MPANNSTLKQFTDAAADRIGKMLADMERDARQQRELQAAEYRAKCAELDARIASMTDLERRLSERIAAVKDGADGASVTVEDVAPIIISEIERRVAEIPAPKDGVDGKDGADGKSVTRDDIAQLIETEVEKRISDIPAPKDGIDGKDADPEFVSSLVAEKVAEAVAQIPMPKDGVDGKDGAPGKFPVVAAWSEKVHYEGDVVSHDGATWQAVRDTGKAPGGDDWICLAAAGRDGADGKSFNPRGLYDESGEYSRMDVVTLNSSSFVANRDDPGICPGEGWLLFAGQGKRGKPGEKGPAGTGLRGLPGDPVKRMSVDGEGMLTLVNGDGSEVRCDLYPILAKISGVR